MSAHRGVWNPVTRLWMFGNVDDCANALCELYHAMRASIAMRETLHEMNLDGTCVAAWNFDPTSDVLDVALSNTLRRDAFSRQVTLRAASSGSTLSRIERIARVNTTSCRAQLSTSVRARVSLATADPAAA